MSYELGRPVDEEEHFPTAFEAPTEEPTEEPVEEPTELAAEAPAEPEETGETDEEDDEEGEEDDGEEVITLADPDEFDEDEEDEEDEEPEAAASAAPVAEEAAEEATPARPFILAALWRGVQERAQRGLLALDHASREHELARAAAARLQPGASHAELRAMMATMRQEHEDAQAAAVTAAEQRQAESQATQLEREALQLEQHVETDVHAAYEAARAQLEAASDAMIAALNTRQDELGRAAQLRAQADALRAPYLDARAQVDTEPLTAEPLAVAA